jgi:hypothetical protein
MSEAGPERKRLLPISRQPERTKFMSITEFATAAIARMFEEMKTGRWTTVRLCVQLASGQAQVHDVVLAFADAPHGCGGWGGQLYKVVADGAGQELHSASEDTGVLQAEAISYLLRRLQGRSSVSIRIVVSNSNIPFNGYFLNGDSATGELVQEEFPPMGM